MHIDVFHDTVCPWCRIGKRHLQLALAAWEGETVQVRYRAFFLNADIPSEGYDFRPYMLAKGGGRIPLEQFFAAPREMGARVGLTFNFEDISRAPNTELSHQLIALAPPDKKEPLIDALYAAYFEDGRDIGEVTVLLEVASSQGLPAAEVGQLLQAGAGLAEVREDVAWARAHGVSGVPFFVINDRYAFSGAQPPQLITRVLQQAAAETSEPGGDL